MLPLTMRIFQASGIPARLRQRFAPNALRDISTLLRNTPIETIFDAGANTGQSAAALARDFPSAAIPSFEPAADSFAELTRRTAQYRNVTCHYLALSSEA